jgi:rubrerythrin
MDAAKAYAELLNRIRDLVGSSLKVEKEIPYTPERKPNFVILKYKYSWALFAWASISINFRDKGERTIVDMKWAYPDYNHEIATNGGLTRALYQRRAANAYETAVTMVENLKSLTGTTEITEEEAATTKEIIREKTVIVKVRCPYCANLYDEALDKCPHCGGHQ